MNPYLQAAEILANLLDNQFHIGNIRFGLDAVFGLFPGGGDGIAAILSLYLIWVGLKLKLPTEKIIRMLLNIALDFFIGVLPVIGDMGDIIFKSNMLNLQILKDHLKVNNIIEGQIVR